MTSYTGPTCSDESIAFEWGPDRGLLTLQYPEGHRPEMKSDVLALGFITSQEDAVLLRVDSGTSNDYMELEIVEGNIFMVYNMGTNDHPIGEIGVKVNDNQYHVVRFTRSGANSTIQVDDYNIQTNHPAGHQLTVFNSQSKVQVGGKWNNYTKRIERPFSGVMAGIVFNGLRILDLAADTDVRTTLRGDVRQLTGGLHERLRENPLLQRMQQTPASGHPGVMDDLVFSGAGSGCNADDEDECEQVFDHGSGDDLITPVYVPPTRPPATATPRSQQNGRGLATETPAANTVGNLTGSTSGPDSHSKPQPDAGSAISRAAENTMVIIASIVGLLILLCLLLLVILRIKGHSRHSDGKYVVRQSGSFRKSTGPNAALLAAAEVGEQYPESVVNVKDKDGEGFKEWYV